MTFLSDLLKWLKGDVHVSKPLRMSLYTAEPMPPGRYELEVANFSEGEDMTTMHLRRKREGEVEDD